MNTQLERKHTQSSAMMRTRRLGRTELQISELVFGGGFVGGLLVLADDDTKREALRRYVDAGGNWIDTAAIYAQGRSEEAIGWLLQELAPAERPYVSTKVGVVSPTVDGAGRNIKSQIAAGFAESTRRLQLESLTLFQLHSQIVSSTNVVGDYSSALTVEEILGPGGVADVFDDLKARGLIGFSGITATGDTDAVLAVIRSGRFDTAQVYYNMLNPSCGWDAGTAPRGWNDSDQDFSGITAACAAADVGVLVIRALASGVLATDEQHERMTAPQYIKDYKEDDWHERELRKAHVCFDALGGKEMEPRAATAVRWVLGDPRVSGCLVGLADLEQLDVAISAAKAGPLLPASMERLDKVQRGLFGRTTARL